MLFLSIYYPGIVPLQPKDIGMVSSIFCATSKEQLIWVYFTQRNQSNNCLDMLMQDTFQTHIRPDHKQGMCFIGMELLFHGDPFKQTMVATSSNHSKIIAIHEASRECIWLRSMIQHIKKSCGLPSIKDNSTTLFEDNVACIAQIKGGYIKRDRTKHISSKFFYTHELQKSGEIDVQQIRSNDNLADLFTKSLPTSTFKKLIYKIGMCQLKDIDMRELAYDRC